jgi:hypothetical protein
MVATNLTAPEFPSTIFTPPLRSTSKIRLPGRKVISIGSSNLPGSVSTTLVKRLGSGATPGSSALVKEVIVKYVAERIERTIKKAKILMIPKEFLDEFMKAGFGQILDPDWMLLRIKTFTDNEQ